MAVVAITWQFIQTERFGSLVNEKVSKELHKRYGLSVTFKNFEIGLVPLATRVVNIELEYKDIYLTAGNLGLEFGFRDIFSKDFSIGNILLKDALIYLPAPKKGEGNEFVWKDIFPAYKKTLSSRLPFKLRGIEVRNSILNAEDYELQVIGARVGFFPNLLMTEFSLAFEEKMFKSLGLGYFNDLRVNGAQGQVQITRDNFRFKNLRLLAENSFFDLTGKLLTSEELQGIKIDSFVDLKKLRKVIPENMVNKKLLPTGSLRLTASLEGPLRKPSGEVDVKGSGLSSSFFNFGALRGKLSLQDNNLRILSAKAWQRKGYLELSQSLDIFNFETRKLIWPEAFIEAKDIFTNDIFFFLPALERAKAELSGPFRLSLREKSLQVKTFEGFEVKDFRLLSDDQKNILINPKVFLGAGSQIDVTYDGKVKLDTTLSFKNSDLNLVGTIDGSGVDISMLNTSKVDFDAFGPLAGLALSGRGPVEGVIKGPLNDVNFGFKLSLAEFKMLGFNLGNISGTLNYSLKNAFLRLIGLKGNYEGLEYDGGGSINFKSKKDALDMKFSIKKGSLKDSSVALKPIFDPLMKYLKYTSFNYSTDVILRGGLSIPLMKVQGDLKASNILILSEDIESLSGTYSLDNNKMKFEKLKFKKVSGTLSGGGEYDLGDGSYSYRGTLANLRVKDVYYYRFLNLGLDGDAYGEFYGVGDKKVFSSRSHIRLTNSSVENVRLNDSILTVYNNKNDLFFTTSILGGELKGEGYLNLSGKKSKKSALSFKLNTPNLKSFAGVLGKHNILNQAIRGKMAATMNSDFYVEDFSKLNLVATLDQLNFSYPGVRINRLKKPLKVEISEGSFKDWDYSLEGQGIFLKSKGTGSLESKFSLKHQFLINSSMTELVTENVEKSQGLIEGEHLLVGSLKNLNQFLKLKGEGLSFKAKALPGLFSNFNFTVLLEDNVLLVKRANGVYGNGKINARGSVKFKFPFPEVNLLVNVEKSRFPILKKSGVVVSGELALNGKSLPYDLSGALAIIRGEVIDEMNDLASSAINSESYQRFIPVGYLEGNVSFINTDISLNSFSPIQIKNGMIDIGLGGNLKIFGSIFSPKFNGELLIENPENKFLFKGHEFVLSEGLVRFIDGARKERPELRFSGVARINDYDVYINLNGPADNMNVEMTSNPPLSQEDILSLLTLGVTSDVSRNLGDRQRQSVTTLSIGSLIMDQLKINQSLNDSLGVRLSIQPEFIEDENNLLEGRTDDRAGGNRFRSSTVLKVQKRVSKKVNLSLSSTVGGSVDQSQEMNVNYKINKSWSLEGVYEVRSNDELEQELPDSVGADVKYQWSF